MNDQGDTATFLTPQDPLIGQEVQGRYRIEKRLGQGGMGAVYLAEHILIQKKVAIKCLHAGLASNPDLIRRFHNEAVAATAIGNPHIVDVTDMGRFDDGSYFMVLEFLDGQDFQKVLDEEGAQPLGRVAHIGAQLCDALEAARLKGIVHRDLKPENIFLIKRHGDRDFVKVLDFGISKFKTDVSGGTRTGELMGTPYYMSPEQVRGEKDLTFKSDIYTTGVILFQALTNSVPFEADTLPALILKIANEPAPDLSSYLPELPPEIIALVRSMLDKHPEARPRNFFEVREVLAPYSNSLAGVTSYAASSMARTLHGVPDQPNVSVIPQPPVATVEKTSRNVDKEVADAKTQVSAAAETAPSPPEQQVLAPSPASSGKTPRFLAAVAILGLAAGASFFLARGGTKEASAPTPAESPNSSRVRVQISTLPPDADLTLDGQAISNPFDGELNKGSQKSTLVVSREGFRTEQRSLILSSDQRMFVALTPAATPSAVAAASSAESPANKQEKKLAPKTGSAPSKPQEPVPTPQVAPPTPPSPPPTEPAKPATPLKKVF